MKFLISIFSQYRVIQNDCRGVNNLSYTIHLVLQMQPHVISFYGGYVKDQVNAPSLPASIPELNYKQLERTRLSC